MAYRNAERMKYNTLVFYDPQNGEYWSVSNIMQYSHGAKVTSMRVDNLLMDNEFVKNLIRLI